RLRPVRAHHEYKLEKELIGIGVASIGSVPQMSVAILATDLAELARPVGQDTGKTTIRQARVRGAAAAIEASADRPAAVRAVLRRRVHAESVLRLENVHRGKLVPGAPEKFGTEQERMIDSAAKRLPAKRCVRAIEIGNEVVRIERCSDAGIVVATGIRTAKINVGRFAKVTVKTKMPDGAHVLPLIGGENIRRITTVHLGGSLEKPVLRRGEEA